MKDTFIPRTRILFLCTGNSARSILAESIANEMFGDVIEARSAGSQPKGRPHELALKTLEAHGLPTDKARSKSWDEFKDQEFDIVITLCDSAAGESCPYFAGAPARAHWGVPDPPAAENPEEAFEQVFEGLMRAMETFTSTPDYDAAARAEIAARTVREQFPDA